MRWQACAVASLIAAAGCGGDAAEDGGGTRAQRDAALTAEAYAEFDPAAFDTISWPSDSARLARGADVYRWACAECHGPAGAGDGGRVLEGDTLRPPSFIRADWRFAANHAGLVRQVYAGNAQGMPHWGLRRTDPRDIDAVAAYIRTVLRQETGTQ